MKFGKRKLYAHGQNKNVCLLQIPKLICEDLNLMQGSFVDIEYDNGTITIIKSNDVEKVNNGAN